MPAARESRWGLCFAPSQHQGVPSTHDAPFYKNVRLAPRHARLVVNRSFVSGAQAFFADTTENTHTLEPKKKKGHRPPCANLTSRHISREPSQPASEEAPQRKGCSFFFSRPFRSLTDQQRHSVTHVKNTTKRTPPPKKKEKVVWNGRPDNIGQ